MNIKQLSKNDLISVYLTHCSKYFPKEELKPVTTIEWLLDKKIYRGFGLYDNDALLGCAFFVLAKDQKMALLDYYTIFEEYRNLGIGGQFLALLTETLKDMEGIFIETENPYFAKDEDDIDLQKRRISFYTRNGAVKTPLTSTTFGVHYRVLFLPIKNEDPSVEAVPMDLLTADHYYQYLDAIYMQLFPEKHYNSKVEIEIISK